MKHKSIITTIVLLIALLSGIVAYTGIFSSGGPGPSSYTSVRGEEVILYGKGVYKDMSAEVAPQGIAQDVVTLFIAVPLLLITLWHYRKGSLRAKVLLTGIVGYFLLTYCFYTLMAMYNQLFLIWVILLSLSFFGFILLYKSLDGRELARNIHEKYPAKFTGAFLMFTAVMISLLWLSIVLPSALDGTVPVQAEHYTTLVVQALDLAIALPASFIAGILLYMKRDAGYALGSVYIVFLTLQMTALSAKIIAMAGLGYNVIPVIFIIPAVNIVSLICLMTTSKNIRSIHETE
jgi:hypothetical protein